MTMNYEPNVCVVGSINMDLTTATKIMPVQGETVIGAEFATYYGGKGANQAIAAARMGANVNMIGAVGEDAFGTELRAHLTSEGISTDGIRMLPDESTGIANIILSEQDNRIIVASGANLSITPAMVDASRAMIQNSDIVLLQMEIPLETIAHTVMLANKYHVPVLLNPAPYQPLPEDVIHGATFMTPNEIELEGLVQDTDYDAHKHRFIVTKGPEGVFYHEDGHNKHIAGHQVQTIDTTGAGDTFNGVLAAMLAGKGDVSTAIRYANAAAALSVTKTGAQTGMPTHDEMLHFIEERNDFL